MVCQDVSLSNKSDRTKERVRKKVRDSRTLAHISHKYLPSIDIDTDILVKNKDWKIGGTVQ